MQEDKDQKNLRTILWIVPRVPWPPACGASFANSSLIKTLAQRGWKIHLLCVGGKKISENEGVIKDQLEVETITQLSMPWYLRHRLTRYFICAIYQLKFRSLPITVMPFVSGRVRLGILEIINEHKAAFVVWDGLHPMAALAQSNAGNRFEKVISRNIYRAHNLESDLWDQFKTQTDFLFKNYVMHQAMLMHEFERLCISNVDATFCLTEEDTRSLRRKYPTAKNLMTIPVGIFPSKMATLQDAGTKRPTDPNDKSSALKLVWLGGMDWWPNEHGLDWFLETVWPDLLKRRKQVHLDVIGKGSLEKIKAPCEGISAHGFVQNPQDFLKMADLMIVPIFFGSGLRIKALEGMSHGLACLGTELGLTGLPTEGCWIAQDRESWLKILTTLSKENCRERGALARGLVFLRHDPHKIATIAETTFDTL